MMITGVGVIVEIVEIIIEIIIMVVFNRYLEVGLIIVFKIIRVVVAVLIDF